MVILEIGSTTRGKMSYLYRPRAQHRSGLASRQDCARPDPIRRNPCHCSYVCLKLSRRHVMISTEPLCRYGPASGADLTSDTVGFGHYGKSGNSAGLFRVISTINEHAGKILASPLGKRAHDFRKTPYWLKDQSGNGWFIRDGILCHHVISYWILTRRG